MLRLASLSPTLAIARTQMRERAAWLVARVVENSDDARVADDSGARAAENPDDVKVVENSYDARVEDCEVSSPRVSQKTIHNSCRSFFAPLRMSTVHEHPELQMTFWLD